MALPAEICDRFPGFSTGSYRLLPGRAGTSEQPWSNPGHDRLWLMSDRLTTPDGEPGLPPGPGGGHGLLFLLVAGGRPRGASGLHAHHPLMHRFQVDMTPSQADAPRRHPYLRGHQLDPVDGDGTAAPDGVISAADLPFCTLAAGRLAVSPAGEPRGPFRASVLSGWCGLFPVVFGPRAELVLIPRAGAGASAWLIGRLGRAHEPPGPLSALAIPRSFCVLPGCGIDLRLTWHVPRRSPMPMRRSD